MQTNQYFTRITPFASSCIDHCITNTPLVVKTITINLNISDHLLVCSVIKCDLNKISKKQIIGRIYKEYDTNVLTNQLPFLDWTFSHPQYSVDQYWQTIINNLVHALNDMHVSN